MSFQQKSVGNSLKMLKTRLNMLESGIASLNYSQLNSLEVVRFGYKAFECLMNNFFSTFFLGNVESFVLHKFYQMKNH